MLFKFLHREFPLVDQHSVAGKVLGTFTAVVAVAVFALPAGIFGSGFEDIITRRREERKNDVEENIQNVKINLEEIDQFIGDETTFKGSLYNFLHLETTHASRYFDQFINFLVIGTSLTFMFDTLTSTFVTPFVHMFFDTFELLAAIIFTIEYVLRVYSAGENPKYKSLEGRLVFATSFLAIVDLLSFLPYWIDMGFSQHLITPYSDKSMSTSIVKCLRLLRLLRFEKYTKAFTTFDDIFRENLDVLSVTGFSAILVWIFFSAVLYYTERDNPDADMANYYKSVPHALWITLLNLSGECPLAFYSVWGKIINGIIGLFATAIFGVPIGLLGAGFEDLVTSRIEDTHDEQIDDIQHEAADDNGVQVMCFKFVNGIGSTTAMMFELSIYFLIAASVIVGMIQTVEGHEDTLHQLEWISVLVFTLEYCLRFIGAGVDPEFSSPSNQVSDGIWSRLKYIVSFYSIVDLLAILPFYLSIAFPDSWFDQHDEYL